MKLLHLSDLHLGKRVNGFSMLEDQRVILTQIVDLAEEEKVDAVLLAGDLYDKPVPPAEAVTLLDRFLTRLSGGGIPVFAISGNHDSPERLAFATRLLTGEHSSDGPVSGAPASVSPPGRVWGCRHLRPAVPKAGPGPPLEPRGRHCLLRRGGVLRAGAMGGGQDPEKRSVGPPVCHRRGDL